MGKYTRVNNSSIGQAKTANAVESCENTAKRVKENLARQEDNKEFILEAMNRDLFNYEEMHRALGRIEVNIYHAKQELKHIKARKKGK